MRKVKVSYHFDTAGLLDGRRAQLLRMEVDVSVDGISAHTTLLGHAVQCPGEEEKLDPAVGARLAFLRATATIPTSDVRDTLALGLQTALKEDRRRYPRSWKDGLMITGSYRYTIWSNECL